MYVRSVPSIFMTASRARVCSCWARCWSAHPACSSLSTRGPSTTLPEAATLRADVSDPTLVSSVDRRIASPMRPYRIPMTVTGAMKKRNVDASNAWDR